MASSIARLSTAGRKSTFAVVFDIDGVLYAGSRVIPGANVVLESLNRARIPYCFLTNGGGVTEEVKMEKLSKMFGVPLQTQQVIQSHTPFRNLAPMYEDKLVLFTGKGDLHNFAQLYGFHHVVTMDEYHALYPELYPDTGPIVAKPTHIKKGDPIEGIFVFMDPIMWSRELQIICDLLRSDGVPNNIISEQRLPIYFSCPDLEYAAEFPIPRFGSGAFRRCLQTLFHDITGRQMQYQQFGKPEHTSYEYTHQILNQMATSIGYQGIHRIYAIGDNPLSDVKGANMMGDPWFSILTRTGIFKGPVGSNDEENPAKWVVGDVLEAMNKIFEEENH